MFCRDYKKKHPLLPKKSRMKFVLSDPKSFNGNKKAVKPAQTGTQASAVSNRAIDIEIFKCEMLQLKISETALYIYTLCLRFFFHRIF